MYPYVNNKMSEVGLNDSVDGMDDSIGGKYVSVNNAGGPSWRGDSDVLVIPLHNDLLTADGC